jgi:hypothetical protein
MALSLAVAPGPALAADGTISVAQAYNGSAVTAVGEYSVCKVASRSEDGSSFTWEDAYASAVPAGDEAITQGMLDSDGARIAQALSAQGGSPLASARTDPAGKAVFSGLRDGIYLVTNTLAPSGYQASLPFLVTIPYEGKSTVNATPKLSLIPSTSPSTPPATTVVTHEEPPRESPKTGDDGLPLSAASLVVGLVCLSLGMRARRPSGRCE